MELGREQREELRGKREGWIEAVGNREQGGGL